MTSPGKLIRWSTAVIAATLLLFGATAWHQGYRVYVVHTGSMQPRLALGDLVIDKPAGGPYRVGEMITFRHSDVSSDVVTHRVAGFEAGRILTKGDANATEDAWLIRPDQVQGIPTRTIPKAGYFVVFLKQPAGIAAVVAAGLGLLLLWDLFFLSGATRPLHRPAHSRPARARVRPAHAAHTRSTAAAQT